MRSDEAALRCQCLRSTFYVAGVSVTRFKSRRSVVSA